MSFSNSLFSHRIWITLISGEGKAYKAFEVLKDTSSPANRYKFALACLKLNRIVDAEKALLNKKTLKGHHMMEIEKHVPNGAAGFYLLGKICEKEVRQKEAYEYYHKAVELDPTLWCAYELQEVTRGTNGYGG